MKFYTRINTEQIGSVIMHVTHWGGGAVMWFEAQLETTYHD
jgi:hypothetical protein